MKQYGGERAGDMKVEVQKDISDFGEREDTPTTLRPNTRPTASPAPANGAPEADGATCVAMVGEHGTSESAWRHVKN